MKNSFGTRAPLTTARGTFEIAKLPLLEQRGLSVGRLPFSLRILLENLLRLEDGLVVTADDIEAVTKWDPAREPDQEIAFMPARVLLQDFTGVPAVVDFAAMRDAVAALGGNARRINPLFPAELVIDHSVQVDTFGRRDAAEKNSEREFERNAERYAFLRWGQKAFANFRVVPPDTGIVHQVNLEYLARGVMIGSPDPGKGGAVFAYPDTVVGTDSHTTMINGLGVLGWGVGGIEAEAAMLGQPVSMLVPQVVGMRLEGALREGTTATDLVLTVTQLLRKHGVVGKFVEFHGPGLARLPLADRATIANMAPEYGATCGMFPVDDETLRYLRLSGRDENQVQLVEAYFKEQGLFYGKSTPEARYSSSLALDLGTVEPSLAGPRRPQDRVRVGDMPKAFAVALPELKRGCGPAVADPQVATTTAPGGALAAEITLDGQKATLADGSVVIAAITSCTNTSNPSVMVAAGLLAQKAVERGLAVKPWVKTSVAPGSQVVRDYLEASGLQPALDRLGFNVVGFGCTTCIGNSGPLPEAVSAGIHAARLVVAAVLSGNRNFEGRIHPDVRANYLASPPLVVAYALAGRADIDLTAEPLGVGASGRPVFLKDVWPSQEEVHAMIEKVIHSDMFKRNYADVFTGSARWQDLPTPEGDLYSWDPQSTYVKRPPFFEGFKKTPDDVSDLKGARVLCMVGDSVTTDHISPAGDIGRTSPAAHYLLALGVKREDFNSYGARRGNHEVMMRGTFANPRLRNALVDEEGGVTVHLPDLVKMSIFDAAMRYQSEGVPLLVLAGKEYGTGSSRDWAAKGPALLGVRAVLAESFERIHRSNLVGMGVLPLQYLPGQTAQTLGLTGVETFDVVGIERGLADGFQTMRDVTVRARRVDLTVQEFPARVRIDTPQEVEYFRHGGILKYVLRRLV